MRTITSLDTQIKEYVDKAKELSLELTNPLLSLNEVSELNLRYESIEIILKQLTSSRKNELSSIIKDLINRIENYKMSKDELLLFVDIINLLDYLHLTIC